MGDPNRLLLCTESDGRQQGVRPSLGHDSMETEIKRVIRVETEIKRVIRVETEVKRVIRLVGVGYEVQTVERNEKSSWRQIQRVNLVANPEGSEAGSKIQRQCAEHVASPGAQLLSSDAPHSEDSEAVPEKEGNYSDLSMLSPPLQVQLLPTGKPQNAQEAAGYDFELEKKLIVPRMLGKRASLDPAFVDDISFVTDVYKSFESGIPRHCALECSTANDPGSCCWNSKRAQFQENKKCFSTEITALVNSFLAIKGKRVVRLPERCITVIDAWLQDHQKDPYMKSEEIEDTAKKLGLSYEQVDTHLQNYRAKKWKVGLAGSSQRKGKHFRHRTEDADRLKAWMQSHNFRHPNLKERVTLSKELQMTPAEIFNWSHNYKKRHKEELMEGRE